MTISATAPAKLIWIGEYAVTEGAPAVVAALDRRVCVDVDVEAKGSRDRWLLHLTPGERCVEIAPDGASGFRLPDGTPAAASPDARLVACVTDRILCRTGRPASDLPPLDARIDSTSLYAPGGRAKLGLGSSAAVVVALGAALRLALDAPLPPGEAFLEDLAAHRLAQEGRGSGVDVASSFHGGVICYERPSAGRAGPRVTRLDVPDSLHVLCVFTGRSADTRAFLEAAEARRRDAPEAFQRPMGDLAALAREARAALDRADVAAWLEAVASYHDALGRLGEVLGVEIVSACHAELAQLALRQGVRYKPSGAGGGDVGVAFCENGADLARAAFDMRRAGYGIIDARVDPVGVQVIEGPSR